MIIINYTVGPKSFSQSRSTETKKLCLFFLSRWWPVFQIEGCFPGNWERMPARPSSGWSGQPTVSAAASPERWGIQDFGWDCILPATSQTRSGQDSAAFSSAVFMVNRLKELFGGEPLPELPPLHGHGGCQQRCQQVEEESDPGDVDWTKWWIRTWWTWVWNQLQISTGGWHCGSLQCRRFLFQQSHQDHQWGRGNSQFLGEGGSKDGVVVYRWPCSEDYTQISSAVVFAKNLQLAPSSLSPGMFVLCWILQEFIWQISSTQMLFTVKSPVDRVNWLQITAL